MKKTLLRAGIVAMGSVLALTLMAGAETGSVNANVNSNGNAMGNSSQAMVLQIEGGGKVLLRGTIDSIGSNTLTVKSWGGDWTVNVPSSAELMPTNANHDLTQLKTGDFVGVQGTVSQSANWTVDATLVRDRTAEQTVSQQQKDNAQSAKETMKSEAPRNFQGTVSNLNGSSFTLATQDGTTFTVNVAPGAQVVNQTWLTLATSGIKNGDTVRVWGANASGTITAQIVRDITIGAMMNQNR